MSDVIEFLQGAHEIADDPGVFDQKTGEVTGDYFVKTVSIPVSLISVVRDRAEANPVLKKAAFTLAQGLVDRLDKSDAHTLLAFASYIALPKIILDQDPDPENARGLVLALSSTAAFGLMTAEAVFDEYDVESTNPPEDDSVSFDEEGFAEAMRAAGFREVRPGVFTGDEQD